jgi:hypothetical protein
MIEGEYMSQEDSKKQLKIKLFKEGSIDYLQFNIGPKVHKLNLNLDDNQSEIKAMFCDLLPYVEANDTELVLEKEEGYDNKLLEEVSISYISDLNKEIQGVRIEILDKYGQEED